MSRILLKAISDALDDISTIIDGLNGTCYNRVTILLLLEGDYRTRLSINRILSYCDPHSSRCSVVIIRIMPQGSYNILALIA